MQYGATGAKVREYNENADISYTYNNQGLISGQNYNLNGTAQSIEYGYDSRGNCIKLGYKNGTDAEEWSYGYDDKSRLTSVRNNKTAKTEATYSYDNNGNLTNQTYGNGTETSYTYNAGNLILSMVNKQNGKDLSKYNYTYNPDGNINAVTSEYDTGNGKKNMEVTYLYDGLGRMRREFYDTKASRCSRRIYMMNTGTE